MKLPAPHLLIVCAIAGMAGVARAGLRETAHNLGPGTPVRRTASAAPGTAAVAAGGGDDLCIFCHTPHNAKGRRGLWSRRLEPVTYKLYQSSTMQAHPQQPTGSSRLCLSCHDGVMAMDAPAAPGGGTLGKLTGAGALGTDLSDDHPISFFYDEALAGPTRELANPATLKGSVRLDETGQVQCTSCHDAHSDQHPDFLVIDPSYSALCVTCHRLPQWQQSAHATSAVPAEPGGAAAGANHATVGQSGCSSCHRVHGAPHPQRLLAESTEDAVCLRCHDGRAAAKDLRREFNRISAHHIDRYAGVHDAAENPNAMPQHVACVDCHNPHAARAGSAGSQIPGALVGVSGVTLNGSIVRQASFEYEVCLKCHGVGPERDPVVFRADATTNVRLDIDPRNASFHPVADVGRNPNVRGLLAPLTPASRTACGDCHNNDAAARGGGAPRGPHGSNYRPLLAAEYHFDARSGAESYQLYALCYGCHDRTTLLNGGFPHQSHVVKDGASCAVCHAAHGSRRNAHLINFMSRDLTGTVAVIPSSSGQLAYESLGPGAGRCFLTCHGVDHNPKEYPARILPAGVASALHPHRRR